MTHQNPMDVLLVLIIGFGACLVIFIIAGGLGNLH